MESKKFIFMFVVKFVEASLHSSVNFGFLGHAGCADGSLLDMPCFRGSPFTCPTLYQHKKHQGAPDREGEGSPDSEAALGKKNNPTIPRAVKNTTLLLHT